MGHDTRGSGGKLQNGVGRPTGLERPNLLEVLRLEEDACSHLSIEGGGGEDRRSMDERPDPISSGLNVG
jgi:hypothetical protein